MTKPPAKPSVNTQDATWKKYPEYEAYRKAVEDDGLIFAGESFHVRSSGNVEYEMPQTIYTAAIMWHALAYKDNRKKEWWYMVLPLYVAMVLAFGAQFIIGWNMMEWSKGKACKDGKVTDECDKHSQLLRSACLSTFVCSVGVHLRQTFESARYFWNLPYHQQEDEPTVTDRLDELRTTIGLRYGKKTQPVNGKEVEYK